MKNKILHFYFFIFFAFINVAQSQIVNIPDANFKNALLADALINTNADTEIQTTEALATTSITVAFKSINDLTGIEAFTNLTSLTCNSNNLTVLNLSQNTALKFLSCIYNNLSVLDLVPNTALTYLNCTGNQLISLNISSCIGLTALACYNNKLTDLDVSANPQLLDIECQLNMLTSLNLTNNIALTSLTCNNNLITGNFDLAKNILLQTVNCGNNKISGLDLSINTALVNIECSGNAIPSLDVTHALSLTGLSCADNMLTALDVSHNLILTQINCPDNGITNLDISKNPDLTTLNCENNKLTSLDVSKNIDLDLLWVSSNKIGNLDISVNIALSTLRCNGCDLSVLNLSTNVNLTQLYCATNKIANLDVSANTRLTTLYCNTNLLTAIDVSKNIALTGFQCSENKLVSLDVSKNINLTFLNCLDNSPSLKTICVFDLNYANANFFKDTPAKWSLLCCSSAIIIDNTTDNSAMCADGISTRALQGSPAGGTWNFDDLSTTGVGAIGGSVFTVGTVAGTAKIFYSKDGCVSNTIDIPVKNVPSIIDLTINNASCSSSGSVIIKLSNATGNYDVDLDGNGDYETAHQNILSTGNVITLLGLAGETIVKNVKVKSSFSGCESSAYVIDQTITSTSIINTTSDEGMCADGVSIRSLTGSPTGGTWSLNPSGTNGIGTINNATTFIVGNIPGKAIITYTKDGCTSEVVVKVNERPSISVSVDDPLTCTGTGTATILVSNPAGNYDVDLEGNNTYDLAYRNQPVSGNNIIIQNLPFGAIVKHLKIRSVSTGCESLESSVNKIISPPNGPVNNTDNSAMCADGISERLLEASPVGGTWSIVPNSTSAGTIDNVNSRFIAGKASGNVVIVYTKDGCADSVKINLKEIPEINDVTPINPLTCKEQGSVTINIKNGVGKYDVDLDGDGNYELLHNGLSAISNNIKIENILNGEKIKDVSVKSLTTGCKSNIFAIDETIKSPDGPINSTDTDPLCANGIDSRALIGVPSGGIWTLESTVADIGIIDNFNFISGKQSGTATIIYTLNECSSRITIFVKEIPSIKASSSNSTICEGGVILLNSTSTTTGSIVWKGPNGFNSSAQNPQIPNALSLNAGDYFVTISNGCTSIPSSVSVNIIDRPRGNFTASKTSFCTGESGFLTSSEISGNQWFLNGKLIENAIQQNYEVNSSGYYNLVVSNNGCLSDSMGKGKKIILAGPDKNISVIGDTVCFGNPGSITLKSAEKEVNYNVYVNNTSIENTTKGNGADLVFSIPYSKLTQTINTINVQAEADGCPSVILNESAKIKIIKIKTDIPIIGDSICYLENGKISMLNSEPGVLYQPMINNISVGASVEGTGQEITLIVNAANLKINKNSINIMATGFGCSPQLLNGSADITMHSFISPAGVITGPTAICRDDIFAYSINSKGQEYVWTLPQEAKALLTLTSGSNDTLINVEFVESLSEKRWISVAAKEGNCLSDTTAIEIKPAAKCKDIFIPNIITPHSNDNNNNWLIDGLQNFPNVSIKILNRWGALVYESTGYLKPWDGNKKNGETLPTGTYYYLIDLKDKEKSRTLSGSVTIIRD